MGVSALILALMLLLLTVPVPAHAESVVELSSSNGQSVCPTYLSGPGVDHVAWDSSSSTCTIFAAAGVSPTVCIASSSGGCSGAIDDRLIVDQGVTVALNTQSNTTVALLCVYSTLENHGTIEGGSICDYGTIINFGTINIPVGNFFETLPYNGFGILDNEKGGDLINNYNFADAGMVVNNGTIHNRGQFGNDNQYNGTFYNNGIFIGSAPCFSYDGCITWIGTYDITPNGTAIEQGTGVSLYITGASGTNVAVISQNQTNAAPLGLGEFNASSAIYFDVLVNGISTGNARVCFTNNRVTPSMAGSMQYWNGTAWVLAGGQEVTTTTVTRAPTPNQTRTMIQVNASLCGDVPVAALNGTPLSLGAPQAPRQLSITTNTSSSIAAGDTWFYIVIAMVISALAVAILLAKRTRHMPLNHPT